jgi:hypothetical protein
MRKLQAVMTVGCVTALVIGILVRDISADTWNKKTVITISEPLQIPGATLTPGKYVFKLMDSSSNRHIVLVCSEDETKVINTILAVPNQRLQPTGKSEFGFWEMPAGSTAALRSWFYPGDNAGQEFAYPELEAMQISKVVKQEVPSVTEEEYAEYTKLPSSSEHASTEVRTPELQPEQQPAPASPSAEVVQSPAPPERPEDQEPPVVPATRTGAEEATLPDTATSFPVLGALGLLSVGLGAAMRILRNRLT